MAWSGDGSAAVVVGGWSPAYEREEITSACLVEPREVDAGLGPKAGRELPPNPLRCIHHPCALPGGQTSARGGAVWSGCPVASLDMGNRSTIHGRPHESSVGLGDDRGGRIRWGRGASVFASVQSLEGQGRSREMKNNGRGVRVSVNHAKHSATIPGSLHNLDRMVQPTRSAAV